MQIFDHLAIEFPEKTVFLRLGGHCTKTGLDERAQAQFIRLSRKAFELCRPCGRWKILPISACHHNGVEIGHGFLELGKDFCYGGLATHLWCGAVTVGSALTEARDSLSELSAGAVYDAVGSECADAAMDMLFALSCRALSRQGAVLDKRRFSPGYGDMPLELQNFFYDELKMEQMGVEITSNSFFVPEKTVTAFAFVHTLQGN